MYMPKQNKIDLIMVMVLVAAAAGADALTPSGLWLFEDEDMLLTATIGEDLELVGEHTMIEGPGGTRAARIGAGSHYRCRHGMAPDGGGEKVNQYTLIMDLRTDLAHRFYALLQTDATNQQDNVCEIMNRERNVGMGGTGRSHVGAIEAHAWFRLALVVDNINGLFDIYRNGEPVLRGTGQAVDGRYGLEPVVLFLGDDDGDDNEIDVARIALFDSALSAEALTRFDEAYPLCPGRSAPELVGMLDGPEETRTGKRERYRFLAAAAEGLVQFRVDWDDALVDDWSELQPADQTLVAYCAYAMPGNKAVRVQLRNECGLVSDWLPLHQVVVKGTPHIEVLTKPYQQNVTPEGITLMWETTVQLPSQVYYGLVDEERTYRRTTEVTPSGFSTFIYKAALTGLLPDTEYHYEVRMGDDRVAGEGVFRTAPKNFKPFAFGVWSDSQGTNKGDYEEDPLEPTKSMLADMAASGVALAVTAGDLAEDGASYLDTRRFYLDRVARYLGTQVPYFIAWGNHDSYQGAVIRRFADLPSKERSGFDPGYGSYAFSYAECRFICLDYASMHTDIEHWLEPELQSRVSREARHRFLFVHVPPYGEVWIDGNAFLREKLTPLLEKYEVDVCFSGHTHAYERGHKEGVHYIITGGGSWLDHDEPVVKEWDHMLVGGKNPVGGFDRGVVHQYMRIHVDEDGWSAECIAYNPDGSKIGVIDRFSFTSPHE